MPRYYFHTEDGHCLPDKEGTVLVDVEAAKVEAIRYLCDWLGDRPQDLWQTGNFRMTVQDDAKMTLFILDLSAILSASFPLSAMPKGALPKHLS